MATQVQIQAARARRGKKVKKALSIGDMKQNYYNNKPLPVYNRPAAKTTVYKSSVSDYGSGNTRKNTGNSGGAASHKETYSPQNVSMQRLHTDMINRNKAAQRYRAEGTRAQSRTPQKNTFQDVQRRIQNSGVMKPAVRFSPQRVIEPLIRRNKLANEKLQDARRMTQNSIDWFYATPEQQKELHEENNAIRSKYGYSYSPEKGTTYDGKFLSLPVMEAVKQNDAKLQKETEQKNKPAPKGIDRVFDTLGASRKRVSGNIDNAFATSGLAATEKAQEKFLKGRDVNALEKLFLKDRWGENWKEYLSEVRDAYRNGDIAKIQEFEMRSDQLSKLYDVSPRLDEAANQAEKAKEGLGKAGKAALDIVGMGADMIGNASIASTGGGGPALFTGVSSVSAAGAAGDLAKKLGANAIKQNEYARAAGLLNYATESLGGIGGSKTVSEAAKKILPQGVKEALGKAENKAIGRVAMNALEEGLEEGLQNEGERGLRNQILKTNEKFDPNELMKSVGYGAAAGGIFGASSEIRKQIGRGVDAAAQNVRKRFGGAGQDTSTTAPQNSSEAVNRADMETELTEPIPDEVRRRTEEITTVPKNAPDVHTDIETTAPPAAEKRRRAALEIRAPELTAKIPETQAPGPENYVPLKAPEPNTERNRRLDGQTDMTQEHMQELNGQEPSPQNFPEAQPNQRRTGAVRKAGNYFYRNIVSGQAEIEKFAKTQEKVNPNNASANDLAQVNRSAGSTVDTIAQTALVDRKGDAIGDGWLNIMGSLTDEQRKLINLYRQHLNNIDRMSLYERSEPQRTIARQAYDKFLADYPEFNTLTENEVNRRARNGSALAQDYIKLKDNLNRMQSIYDKPVLGHPDGAQDTPYTAAESRSIVAEMENANPWLREYTEKAENFHDAFMKEWAVGSGLMSEEQFNALKEKYPHYVQTYRSREKWGDADATRHGRVDAASPIKEAVGDISEIVPFEDAEMKQVNSIVKSARRNELFRNIYDFAKANPEEAAPYVRITGEDIAFEMPDNIEDFAESISRDAMSDQGGIYTIRVIIDGAPKIMQVSSEFYAGLQNLFGQDRGASDSFLSRTAGKLTNGFKLLTTGKNPLFFLTNLPKDFQTAYINTTSERKLLLFYAYDVLKSLRHMVSGADDWKAFQALGGADSSYYHNEKGFTQSAADSKKHRIIKTLWKPVDTISENTEALWRFNEYRAALKKYGDTQEGRAKAIQAAADVTTNFSRSAPATKAAENYCAYLNAGVQGLDKMARQLKNHPFLTTRRAAEIIALPTLFLWYLNRDDEDYQNLNNRTKDNYFCINTKYLTREDEGKFIKIPKSREYGVAMGALLERFFRLAEGGEGNKLFEGMVNDMVNQFKINIVQSDKREKAFKDIGEQFLTNLMPSNPVTDNIFKTVFIDLPTNMDFAGRTIIPERMLDLSPKNQYDYNTSGAGFRLSKAWNASFGKLGPQLAPIQADYLIDSNLGFLGDAIIGLTTNPKSPKEFLNGVKENPKSLVEPILNTLEQKFIADPLYQSGVTDEFYDELDKAERAANDKNLEQNIPSEYKTPEEKYLSKLNEASDNISELRKQERALLSDRSISDDERESKIRDIRRQIIEIAKAAPAEALKAKQEYEKIYVAEVSDLSDERQEDAREAIDHGVDPAVFAAWEERLSTLVNEEGPDDKHVRSKKEAIAITLDEIMADTNLTDPEKQAIADYQLTSVLGDEDKEDWGKVKGIVNASDFLEFETEVAKYREESKNTGDDKAANVANMLMGYEGIDDNQRDHLFQVYSDNMSKNPFHVSEYEKNIDAGDSFFSSLQADGKAQLRSLLNEYEQKINEGKELTGWLAKASEAQEAGIRPQTYAMYRVALSMSDQNGDGRYKQEEAQNAINSLSGLTQQQKAYLYQSTNSDWKKNPFGSVGALEDTGEEQEDKLEAEGTLYNAHGPLKAEFLGKADGNAKTQKLSTTRESGTFVWPTPGNTNSSSAYGWRVHPIYGTQKFHKGEDIPAPSGAPIVAAASGTVVSAGWAQGYGNYTVIDHGNGVRTAYGHQSAIGVQPGQQVQAGQQIGRVGSTGNSTGPHLHFEVYVNGETQNPMSYFGGEIEDSRSYPSAGYSNEVDYSGSGSAGYSNSGYKSYSGAGKYSGRNGSHGQASGFVEPTVTNASKGYNGLEMLDDDSKDGFFDLPRFRSLARLRRLHSRAAE